MRPSKRTEILEAARRIVARDGLSAVTYDAVAAEAGLTKGGVVYHFASRDELIVALCRDLAEQWESELVAIAGAPVDQLTEAERLEAYARESLRGSTYAELQLVIETCDVPAARAEWAAVIDRWAGTDADGPWTDRQLDLFVLRLAADGLWIHDAIAGSPLSRQRRAQLLERIVRGLRDGG